MERFLLAATAVIILLLAKKGRGYRLVVVMTVAALIVALFMPLIVSKTVNPENSLEPSDNSYTVNSGDSENRSLSFAGSGQEQESEGRDLADSSTTAQREGLSSETADGVQEEVWSTTEVKKQMGLWEFGTGSVGIAVRDTRRTSVVDTVYGFRYQAQDDSGQYVWLLISASNSGDTPLRIGPNNFFLSAGDGYKVSRDTSTFAQDHFRETDLLPGQSAGGWIIFYVPVKNRYILHFYDGLGHTLEKMVAW